MANRHSHKKLRAMIRARMAVSGESYQAARHRLLQEREERAVRGEGVDLVAATYFGVPVTVATFDVLSRLHMVFVSGGHDLLGSPWGLPSILRLRSEGVQ